MPDNEKKKKEVPSVESQDGVIKRSGDSGAQKPVSRLDLLDSFLKQITGTISVPVNSSPEDIKDIHSFELSEYPEMETSGELERKISELQKIAVSIEKKNSDIGNSDQQTPGKYKVNYLSALNPAQLAAVLITEKPVLVIAGAGSGKTRVIVHRVSYLIEKGIDAQSILLLTFTRKASREMLDRVETLLQDKRVGNVTGGTFHSFAAFILRKYCNMLNLPPNFTIIDASDSEDIIDLIRTELRFNTRDKKFPRKERIHDIISYSRNRSTTIASIVHEQYTGLIDYIPDIELIFTGYSKYKTLSRILDFDDLMEFLRNGLRDNLRFRESVQKHYQYVMVDEFQDTNTVQKEIVDYISEKTGALWLWVTIPRASMRSGELIMKIFFVSRRLIRIV